MNQTISSKFTPILTSSAGSCLTLDNWKEIGIDTVTYYLDTLLMKPGISLLNEFANLRDYCGWSGTILLNARLLIENDGIYTIRSRYDGSLIKIKSNELFSLIEKLQPDSVILPATLTNYSPLSRSGWSTIFRLFPATKTAQNSIGTNMGYFFHYDKTQPFTQFVQMIRTYLSQATTSPHFPISYCLPDNSITRDILESTDKLQGMNREKHESLLYKVLYVTGEFTLSEAIELTQLGPILLESDSPAMDAFAGRVYHRDECLNLLNLEMAHQHTPIDEHCTCPTCTQKFTRAYLHHLLTHTPLLCQRFLIQHNVFYWQNKIQKLND